MLTIGLTGSRGFIGSAISQKLVTKYNIIVLDSLVRSIKGETKIELPAHIDWILHFGASKSIVQSFENPTEFYKNNILSTVLALDIAIKTRARFIFMSSYVYGNPKYLPVDELHPTMILNPYMGSKLLCEQICFHFYQHVRLSVVVLRGFTLYGPNQKGDQLIPSIIHSIKKRKPIIVNDPLPKRDYLYIDDFINLLENIINSNYYGFETYNVGGYKSYQNIIVAQMAKNISGINLPIIIKDLKRTNDVDECYANIEKAMNHFSWKPHTDLSTGLRHCIYNI